MKAITMYKCPHCKKIFATPNRHKCRRDPALKNCYSCANWLHQFVIDHNQVPYEPEDTCLVNSDFAKEAYPVMVNKKPKYTLDCPDWIEKGL